MVKPTDTETIEETKPFIIGHLLIKDGDTGEVLVNQRDTLARQKDNAETKNAEGE